MIEIVILILWFLSILPLYFIGQQFRLLTNNCETKLLLSLLVLQFIFSQAIIFIYLFFEKLVLSWIIIISVLLLAIIVISLSFVSKYSKTSCQISNNNLLYAGIINCILLLFIVIIISSKIHTHLSNSKQTTK